jgi:16S rRNA (adenine1518-N6/adenine1519-N6)-dimethyltransferase
VELPWAPTVLAANLPYNVAVPVLLHLLAALPSLERGVVMVQAEVADRMCAGPGSRVYGGPSAKLAWFAAARLAGVVPRSVFWPVPNVDSKLVAFTRRDPPATSASRQEVFAVIDAAFGQRRKTLRAALAGWAGSPAEAERLLRAACVDPRARGESLGIAEFARVAAASRLP